MYCGNDKFEARFFFLVSAFQTEHSTWNVSEEFWQYFFFGYFGVEKQPLLGENMCKLNMIQFNYFRTKDLRMSSKPHMDFVQNFHLKKFFEYPKKTHKKKQTICLTIVFYEIPSISVIDDLWLSQKKEAMIQEIYGIWFKVYLPLIIIKFKKEKNTIQCFSFSCLKSKISFFFWNEFVVAVGKTI